jgi:peptidoglycan/LPS O-acetylase OafA/YrhL
MWLGIYWGRNLMFHQREISAHQTTAYYPSFDYLRFVLAAMVVAGHSLLAPDWTAHLAVSVFFALSGWLIGGILLQLKNENLPRFYYNRATRIWIPYFAAIILLYGLSATKEPITWRWLEFLLYHVTFVFNWFTTLPDAQTALVGLPLGWGVHFWSICVEEQFYLFAPAFIIFLPFLGRSLVVWSLITAALVVMQNEFAAISIGVLAAVCRDRFGDWHLTKPVTLLLLLACATTAALLPLFFRADSPLFAVTVVLLLARPGRPYIMGGFLGGASYPIYLNHPLGLIIGHSIVKRVFPGMSEILPDFALGILVGVIMYLLIDRIVMERRAAYFTRTRGIQLALTGYSLVVFGLTFGILRWYVFS